jgi:hypothetical protein
MVLVKQGFRGELDVNNEQMTACLQQCGASRFAYNYGLRRKQEAYKAGQRPHPLSTCTVKSLYSRKTTRGCTTEASAPFKKRCATSITPLGTSSANARSRNRGGGRGNAAIRVSNRARRALAVLVLLAPFTSTRMLFNFPASDCSD